MFPIRDILQNTSVVPIQPGVGDIVAPPAQRDWVELDGEEDDDGRQRQANLERRGHDKRILLPPAGEAPLDVDVEEPGDPQARGVVAEVVRGQQQGPAEDHGDVDLPHPATGEPSRQEVEGDGQESPDQEPVQRRVVDAV